MNNLPDINSCTIAVVGLGYVGLPVAIEFAKHKFSLRDKGSLKRQVIGFDINKNRISELKSNIDKTNEINSNDINRLTNIIFTHDELLLIEADVFIVTVPTPIDESNNPDFSFIIKACKLIGKAIKKNRKKYSPVIIFESTLYPGASEEILMPIIAEESELKIFEDSSIKKSLAFGYSPERINPGDNEHKISTIVKVTSGNSKKVSIWVDELYGSIIEAGTYNTDSIKVAEAAKVIENTQRDLNIALINELSIIFRNLNIDTLDVINAAKTKWNFLPFKPGLVGGHCIGVDPYYLTYKSEQSGYIPEVILAGRRINDGMANWHIEQLVLIAVSKGINVSSLKALILGFTFKENCPDIRNTKVYDVKRALDKFNITNQIVDPYANKVSAFEEYGVVVSNDLKIKEKFSLIIVAVAHREFCNFSLNYWKLISKKNCLILDLKGIVPRELNPIRP